MYISNVAKRTTPLCFLNDGRLLCYHRGKVIVMNGGKVEDSLHLPISLMEKIFGWNRAVFRLLRFGVRVSEPLDDSNAILCIGNTLYEVDVDRGKISPGWYCGEGIRPLFMTTVKDIAGFEDGLYFGGYLMNREKKPVHIYRRIGTDKWDIAYTFSEGAINHVHCIVADIYRQCLWIFTGDFDEAAAIWKVTDNFKKVERIACNDQKFRGCVVHVLPDGLLYATDAPFADNYIYLMNPDTLKTKTLFPLHGSCIYGCQWKDNYVFSSTVESDGRTSGRLRLFYHGNRGVGIKDDFVHLYFGNLSDGFKEIYKEKKDYLSFLFQFGVFKFPYGVNNSDTLYFQPMATKENDLRLMTIKEENI